MTEKEICREYRQAKDRAAQIRVLAELNATSAEDIVGVLVRGGEELPTGKKITMLLIERMETIDSEITKLTREYKKVVKYLERGE